MVDMGASCLETLCPRPAADVRWVVETRGVLLFGSGAARRFLNYPQASIWDFMSRGYPPAKIVELLCAIARIEQQAAERLYVEYVSGLMEEGYIERPVDE
jgi:hypothetical protein